MSIHPNGNLSFNQLSTIYVLTCQSVCTSIIYHLTSCFLSSISYICVSYTSISHISSLSYLYLYLHSIDLSSATYSSSGRRPCVCVHILEFQAALIFAYINAKIIHKNVAYSSQYAKLMVTHQTCLLLAMKMSTHLTGWLF